METAAARWFGRFPVRMESREGTHLQDPPLPGLSVKIRGGGVLEVKAYRGSPGILEVGRPGPRTHGVLADRRCRGYRRSFRLLRGYPLR